MVYIYSIYIVYIYIVCYASPDSRASGGARADREPAETIHIHIGYIGGFS